MNWQERKKGHDYHNIIQQVIQVSFVGDDKVVQNLNLTDKVAQSLAK